jgi:hypothetical protein
MAAERPTKLTKEASEELIAEAKDELAVLRQRQGQAAAGGLQKISALAR